MPLQAIALAALDQFRAARESRGSLPRRPAAGYLTSTTSATATGNLPKSRRASCRCAASTISATRSQPSRSVPASQPSTSRATHGSQPDHDRPPLRPPARDGREHAIRLLGRLCGHQSRRRPSLGRPMDAAAAHRRRSRQRKQRLSRRKPKAPLTDSNRRPLPYHGGALPTELRGHG